MLANQVDGVLSSEAQQVEKITTGFACWTTAVER